MQVSDTAIVSACRRRFRCDPVNKFLHSGSIQRFLRGDDIVSDAGLQHHLERIDEQPCADEITLDRIATQDNSLASDSGLDGEIVVTKHDLMLTGDVSRAHLLKP